MITQKKEVHEDTPIAMLTVGELKRVFSVLLGSMGATNTTNDQRKYAYGIPGIAKVFGCSIPTAHRIKASGKIDGAIKQIGRKIIVDADLALELAGRKEKEGAK